MRRKPSPSWTPEQREAYVVELRRRFLAGTLQELLVPADADVDRILRDLWPGRDVD